MCTNTGLQYSAHCLPGKVQVIHMWQSQLQVECYSISYFGQVTKFNENGAYMCFLYASHFYEAHMSPALTGSSMLWWCAKDTQWNSILWDMMYFSMWDTIYQERWTDFPVGCKQLFVRSEQYWHMDIHTYFCIYVCIYTLRFLDSEPLLL